MENSDAKLRAPQYRPPTHQLRPNYPKRAGLYVSCDFNVAAAQILSVAALIHGISSSFWSWFVTFLL